MFSEQVYKEGVLTLSLHCAKEAARRNAKKYIEVSTGQVYTADKVRQTVRQHKCYLASCLLEKKEEGFFFPIKWPPDTF